MVRLAAYEARFLIKSSPERERVVAAPDARPALPPE